MQRQARQRRRDKEKGSKEWERERGDGGCEERKGRNNGLGTEPAGWKGKVKLRRELYATDPKVLGNALLRPQENKDSPATSQAPLTGGVSRRSRLHKKEERQKKKYYVPRRATTSLTTGLALQRRRDVTETMIK